MRAWSRFESVAVAFGGDDFGVVYESVDHGRGGHLIADDQHSTSP
jgi:hypothetical protein